MNLKEKVENTRLSGRLGGIRACANAQPFLCNDLGPFQTIVGNLLGPFSGNFQAISGNLNNFWGAKAQENNCFNLQKKAEDCTPKGLRFRSTIQTKIQEIHAAKLGPRPI